MSEFYYLILIIRIEKRDFWDKKIYSLQTYKSFPNIAMVICITSFPLTRCCTSKHVCVNIFQVHYFPYYLYSVFLTRVQIFDVPGLTNECFVYNRDKNGLRMFFHIQATHQIKITYRQLIRNLLLFNSQTIQMSMIKT